MILFLHPNQGLHNIAITLRDFELKLKSLKENSAPGPDIHPKVLKRCYRSLAMPVWMILKKSLDE